MSSREGENTNRTTQVHDEDEEEVGGTRGSDEVGSTMRTLSRTALRAMSASPALKWCGTESAGMASETLGRSERREGWWGRVDDEVDLEGPGGRSWMGSGRVWVSEAMGEACVVIVAWTERGGGQTEGGSKLLVR